MRASLALAVLVVLVSTSLAAPSDLVTNLPGFGPLPQKTYGGYVTVNEQYGANLYYWYVRGFFHARVLGHLPHTANEISCEFSVCLFGLLLSRVSGAGTSRT
jgi:hypothetical protein